MSEQKMTPEARPPFKPCAKCEAVQDTTLLCGPCADRFADRLAADPAFGPLMVDLRWKDTVDRALARLLTAKSPHV